jgi:DNA-binding CsgD family transcriptional regulator
LNLDYKSIRQLGLGPRSDGRSDHCFLILDAAYTPISWSLSIRPDDFLSSASLEIRTAIQECGDRNVAIVVQGEPHQIIRIQPTHSSSGRAISIFIESVAVRDRIAQASKRFKLTLRETEVLKLLVDGLGNAQIADSLIIAATTAGDHVKHLLEKTGSSRRSQIISKVLGGRDRRIRPRFSRPRDPKR